MCLRASDACEPICWGTSSSKTRQHKLRVHEFISQAPIPCANKFGERDIVLFFYLDFLETSDFELPLLKRVIIYQNASLKYNGCDLAESKNTLFNAVWQDFAGRAIL